jgi:hypothetical protein
VNLDRDTSARNPGDIAQTLRCRGCGYQALVFGYPRNCPMCQGAVWDRLDFAPLAQGSWDSSPDGQTARPTWEIVEEVLAALSATQARFSGVSGRSYQLERYDPSWRVLAVAEENSRWVEVEDIRGCWETFERLGQIQREDVLDPGRCSSFMMALFEQVPGIERGAEHNASLIFA